MYIVSRVYMYLSWLSNKWAVTSWTQCGSMTHLQYFQENECVTTLLVHVLCKEMVRLSHDASGGISGIGMGDLWYIFNSVVLFSVIYDRQWFTLFQFPNRMLTVHAWIAVATYCCTVVMYSRISRCDWTILFDQIQHRKI